MKNFKKVLALVLVLATLMGLATVAGAAYKDADEISADYTEATKVLELIETMEGYPDGSFGPKKTITREEAAKLIAIFDNKDADIETYYTSINPFADEKGRWGESYVGYGFRAGIIAGMNATTFAPTANVTGTQFLKMVLVTLGYDAEAEGFVGASWAVNVLALAKRIGLVDDLADGWKAENDLTREEAAQILLNALNTETVEYGSQFKAPAQPVWESISSGNKLWTGFWMNGKCYVTVAGAITTGTKLYKDFDLTKTTSSDAFYRPTTKWTLNQDSVSVMWNPKATFTTEFSVCDLLVALGIDKKDQDTEIVIDAVYCDGAKDSDSALLAGNDTYKAVWETENETDQNSWHHENADCKNPTAATAGAQGTLTQVFYMGKDAEGVKHYRVCSIETWLGKVTKVSSKTTARDDHLKGSNAVKIEAYFNNLQEMPFNGLTGADGDGYCQGDSDHCDWMKDSGSRGNVDATEYNGVYTVSYDDPEGLAKDDYVLFTYSFKDEEVVTVEVTEGKDGRLSGYKYGTVAKFPTETRIDGEYVTDAAHFHLGYDDSKKQNYGTYTFFYDAYGNVIGMTDAASTSKWGVVDRAWVTFTGEGEEALNAKVVGMDGEFTTSTIKELGYTVSDKTTYTEWDDDLAYNVARLFNVITTYYEDEFMKPSQKPSFDKLLSGTNGESYKDFGFFYDHLYQVTTDSNGKFTIVADVDSVDYAITNGEAVKVVKGKPALYTSGSNRKIVATNANTEYLVHVGEGKYEAFTGYKNVKSLVADHAEYVENDDGIAEVVYLYGNVCFTDGSFYAYVGKSADNWVEEVTVDGADYYVLKAFVDGKETLLYIEEETAKPEFDATAGGFEDDFYKFQYVSIDDVTVARMAADDDTVKDLNKNIYVNYFDGDVLETTNNDDPVYYLAEDCPVYGIYQKGVVELDVAEIEDLYLEKDGSGYFHTVCFTANDDDEITALYFYLLDND